MKSSSPKPSESEQKFFQGSLCPSKNSATTAMLITNGGRGGGKSLKMVRKRYSDLNNLICELPSKLSEISSDIDGEFLSAYRTHMQEIQRDLQSLKQQIAVAEAALHDDRAVATLENEVNWFSGEISQLKSHAVNTRKDIASTLSSVSTLNEEIILLNDELKQVLKHSTVLETEINETSMLLNSNRENSSRRTTGRSISGEQIYCPKSQTSTMTSKQHVNNLKSGNLFKTCPASAVQSSSSQSLSLSLSRGHDSQYHRNMSRACSANTTIKDDARSLVDELLSDRTSDEALLEEELYHIYKESILSKKLSARYHGSHKSSRNQWDDSEEEKQLLDHCRRMGGLTGRGNNVAMWREATQSAVTMLYGMTGTISTTNTRYVHPILREEDYVPLLPVAGLGLDHFSHQNRLEAMQNYLQHPAIFERVVQVLAMSHTTNKLESR